MRTDLDFLLLDGFDPETGELALRAALRPGQADVPRFLRLRLHLGRKGDPLQPLRRELERHARLPLPPLWERGLRLVVHAIEEDMAGPRGRDPDMYLWVETQILHPSDERRSTVNHSIDAQAQILFEWASRLESDQESSRAAELFERVLLLRPCDSGALRRLSALLGELGMVEECLGVTGQWMRCDPGEPEAALRHGEALVYLERPGEALAVFRAILGSSPMHPYAHIGAAQSRGLLGGDPFPHLDAAFELNSPLTVAVLRETFDYRTLSRAAHDAVYGAGRLPALLGVTPAELRAFAEERRMPLDGADGAIRESELSRWVGVQNRYGLLPFALHWSAPTPAGLPDVP